MRVKQLALGHIARKYLRPDLNPGPPVSRPGSLSKEPPSCSHIISLFLKKFNYIYTYAYVYISPYLTFCLRINTVYWFQGRRVVRVGSGD